MAELSKLSLTLEQTEAQRAVRVVRIGYDYTLICTPVERERNVSFKVWVDVLGHDSRHDNILSADQDIHIVECGGKDNAPITSRRSFLVGQSLLDEGTGTDQVRVRVVARSDSGEEVALTSAVVAAPAWAARSTASEAKS